ncbi:hypothetical protein OE88DRAFT_526877 [Heliocybe sulcata]|uniref:DUF6534 domain-containing protein n=1 Tax=Heliocybe sulcata TaxID=5364 RepID=A0A5C3N3V1_9AGAM|nr:hypothetical protein OE88DRAFT_526877 [Heliocybe sulcata]
MWIGGAAVATIITDVGITTTMVYRLCTSPQGTILLHSRPVVQRLIYYFVVSGLFMCIEAGAVLVSFFAAPGTMLFGAIYLVGGKIYVNSLLSMLNNRSVLRSMLAHGNHT